MMNALSQCRIGFLCFAAAVLLGGVCTPASRAGDAPEPVWKTAYIKRGFVGDFRGEWAGGPDAVRRMRTPLAVGGSQFKVFVQGSFADKVELTRLSLIRGADEAGKVEGDEVPVTFDGKRSLTLEPRAAGKTSDVMKASLSAGTWYVDEAYASPTFPYAYEVDAGFWRREGGDKPGSGKFGARTGVLRRIDVLTTDKRPLVVCYGDSITAGVGSTPNAGKRYPDVLAKLADRPVLNMGVNGDQLSANAHAFLGIRELAGVEQVIMLLGTNDVVLGKTIKSADDYAKLARQNIDELHKRKITVIWGTIPPCGKFKGYDTGSDREKLRQAINAWIRTESHADAVVDFDKALADPANPLQLKADYHSGDWLHPSDAGYQAMGEAAADAMKRLNR